MPNHCKNILTILGPDVAGFRDSARGVDPAWPPQFEGDPAVNRSELVLSFHSLVPIPAGVILGGYDRRRDEPGEPLSGHECERALWGVKWGAYEESLDIDEPDRLVYSFQTAWAAPGRWLHIVSAMFPDLSFYLSYSEEYPTRGQRIYRAGKLEHAIDDSADDFGDVSDDWGRKYTEAHDGWVARVGGAS